MILGFPMLCQLLNYIVLPANQQSLKPRLVRVVVVAADSKSGTLLVTHIVWMVDPSVHSHLVVVLEVHISQIKGLFKLDSATGVAKLDIHFLSVVSDVKHNCLVPNGTCPCSLICL